MPVKAMEHTITQADPNIVGADMVATVVGNVYVYTVPRHTAIQIRPEDILAAELDGAVNGDTFRLLVQDPNGLTQEVLAQGDYRRILEFVNRDEVLRLGLSKLVKSDYQIILEVINAAGGLVVDSFFQLTCLRYAEVL